MSIRLKRDDYFLLIESVECKIEELNKLEKELTEFIGLSDVDVVNKVIKKRDNLARILTELKNYKLND